ncbi:HEPN domain-containing protein [Phascolarctobacterium succinatutens]|uniref:HEPN domain-containing protein n=1 Tax=Phascolarctobacterium succinatutens TaxID=626940 RepID=UPI003AAC2D45
MESDRIERQYQDSKDLVAYLMGKGEVSFATYIDSVYKKVLVLSAASYFESVISNYISTYATRASGPDKRIVTLIENKVIERQYHTLFDWDAKNTNRFWSLFGENTKSKVREQLNSDGYLKSTEQAFIELGRQRNLLVHENFAEYDVNTTVEEIYAKYKLACEFVSFIATVLDPAYLKN